MDAVSKIFEYLRKHSKGKIVIDPSIPKVRNEANVSTGFDWNEFYPNACEDIPNDCPPSCGKMAHLTCYVDADHARDKLTRRSVTGIVLLVNNTPLMWISKRQKTVETSTYGSGLVAA